METRRVVLFALLKLYTLLLIACDGPSAPTPKYYLSTLNPDELLQTYVSTNLVGWGGGHVHEDLPPIRGGAIVANPRTNLLHIAYLYPPAPASDQSVRVITGLGVESWLDGYSSLDLPAVGEEGDGSIVQLPTMSYLANDQFGLSWSGYGKVYTALYHSISAEADSLHPGPTLEDAELTTMITATPTMAHNDGQLLLLWEWGDRARGVVVARGELLDNSFVFEDPVRLDIPNDGISNVVVHDNKYYFVTRHTSTNDLSYKLYSSGDGLEWSVEQSCSRGNSSEKLSPIVAREDGSIAGLVRTVTGTSADYIYKLALFDMATCSQQELQVEYYPQFTSDSMAGAQ